MSDVLKRTVEPFLGCEPRYCRSSLTLGHMPSRLREEIAGPLMDSHAHPDRDPSAEHVSEVHNSSVDEDAARRGACAQVHLATGAMCTLRHGHEGSCEFSPAADVEALLTEHKAAEHW